MDAVSFCNQLDISIINDISRDKMVEINVSFSSYVVQLALDEELSRVHATGME